MIPCTEEEYFYKVDNMLLGSTNYIRHLFRTRWKEESGEDWKDTKEFIQSFVNGMGADTIKRLPQFQKKTLTEGCLSQEWDMSLLSAIIQNFGDPKKYEKENGAVRKMKNMRNDLAHHSSKKYTQDEYNQKAKEFKEILFRLGMEENDIDKLIAKAGVTSALKAYAHIKTLFEQGENLIKSKNFEKAAQRLSDAVSTPSLLPNHLGEAYEKRADCYLKSVNPEIPDDQKRDLALNDALQALELNNLSWNAYFLVAKCYRLKRNFTEAIHYYEVAMAKFPVQKQIKMELDSCRVLAGILKAGNQFDPEYMPANLQEYLKEFASDTGTQMTEKEFMTQHLILGKLIKGHDHVFRGNQYFFGWNVTQSYSDAVRCYAKADKLGNPEGTYCLARCYLLGYGVEHNVHEALKIYRRAAEMDERFQGYITPLGYNHGVANAKVTIGKFYAEGVVVEKDFAEAAKWFTKAMDQGVGNGAANLAPLYYHGLGVPINRKMAEMCWKQGVKWKSVASAESLVMYYISELEPDLAYTYIQIGKDIGSYILSQMPVEEINRTLEAVRSARELDLGEILDFETSQKLEIKGLTFQQRLKRMQLYVTPISAKLDIITETMAEIDRGTEIENDTWGGKAQPVTVNMLNILLKKAVEGSEIAVRFFKTYKHFTVISEMILKKNKTQADKLKIVNLFYECLVEDFDVFHVPPDLWKRNIKEVIAELFHEHCDKEGEDDMKIRYCYIGLNLRPSYISTSDTYALTLLREGVRRYPENRSYHGSLIRCLGHKHMEDEAMKCANEAVNKFPCDSGLQYQRAVQLTFCRADHEVIINEMQKYLGMVSRENRKVPQAYYNISAVYSQEFPIKEETVKLVEYYFQRGKEAEKDQLPYYLPYGESSVQRAVKLYLTAMNKMGILDVFPEYLKDTSSLNEPKSVLERKEYLKSPARKEIILMHRKALKDMKKFGFENPTYELPTLKQPIAKKLLTMKPITLREISPTKQHIYKNQILDVTIIDEPNPYSSSIHLVAEDDNGDITRLFVFNMARDQKTLEKFQPGCRISIINPFMQVDGDYMNCGIRNDEPTCIVYLEKVTKMCRFCGIENSERKCSICKRPYCSKECQTLDWKEFKHKYICS